MALDAKAIKEEVLDKDMYDSNTRRAKGKSITQVLTKSILWGERNDIKDFLNNNIEFYHRGQCPDPLRTLKSNFNSICRVWWLIIIQNVRPHEEALNQRKIKSLFESDDDANCQHSTMKLWINVFRQF